MDLFVILLAIPLVSGALLTVVGERAWAPNLNIIASLGTFLAVGVADRRDRRQRPALRLRRAVLHRFDERLLRHADGLRRPDHQHLLRPLHEERDGARPAHHAAPAPLQEHVPALHVHHAGGADHQQPGHPLGGDGGGDADHRAAGLALPHAGQPRSGLEVLHPLRRRHRPGAVRHHPALLRRRARAGRNRQRAAVDPPGRGQGPARADHHGAVLHLPAGRLRHQGRPGAAAQLAARRPRRRSDAGLGGALRPAAQRRALRHPALQGAGRRRHPQRLRRQPDDGLRSAHAADGRLLPRVGRRTSSACSPIRPSSTWA